MNQVIFDEEQTSPKGPAVGSKLTGLPKLLNRLFPRLITSGQDANIALLLIFFACVVLIVFLQRSSGTVIINGGPGPSQAELDEYRKIQPY